MWNLLWHNDRIGFKGLVAIVSSEAFNCIMLFGTNQDISLRPKCNRDVF